jgi:subtilisin family serine protease
MKLFHSKAAILVLTGLALAIFGVNIGRSFADGYADKIDPAVLDLYLENEYANYLVIMKAEADIETNARYFGDEALEITARESVIEELKTTSEESQASLIDFLEEQKLSGAVINYETFYIVNMIEVTGDKESVEKIASYKEVKSIIPNFEITIPEPESLEPEFPGESNQNLRSYSIELHEDNYENLTSIKVPEVWDLGVKGKGVVVAVIDTGVNPDHPALSDKWVGLDPEYINAGWNDVSTEASQSPMDRNGHGTHIAGTIMGAQADGTYKVGVAPEARWMGIKFFNENNSGSATIAVKAAEWIMAPPDKNGVPDASLAPDIVNSSWGHSDSNYHDIHEEYIKAWRAAGILPIFSVGNADSTLPNGPGSVVSPGSYPNVFTVGAVNNAGEWCDFSLQGPGYNGVVKPDIMAPGYRILSSYKSSYAYASGTSMAAPHIAGVAALIKSAKPELTNDQIEEVLRSTADPITTSEFSSVPNNRYGYGRVNALAAVLKVLENPTPSPTASTTTAAPSETAPTGTVTATSATVTATSATQQSQQPTPSPTQGANPSPTFTATTAATSEYVGEILHPIPEAYGATNVIYTDFDINVPPKPPTRIVMNFSPVTSPPTQVVINEVGSGENEVLAADISFANQEPETTPAITFAATNEIRFEAPETANKIPIAAPAEISLEIPNENPTENPVNNPVENENSSGDIGLNESDEIEIILDPSDIPSGSTGSSDNKNNPSTSDNNKADPKLAIAAIFILLAGIIIKKRIFSCRDN